MRILETLTPTQQINILSGNIDGIFTTMFADSDVFKEHHKDLCIGYYIYHSADKSISPTFDRFRTMSATPEQFIGQLIRSKFIDKWNRVYDALIVSTYNTLDGKEYTLKKDAENKNTDTYDTTKTKEGTDTDTTTYDLTRAKEGDNSDTTTFNTNVEDDGNRGIHEVTSRENSTDNDVYGFNSTTPVGDSKITDTSDETFTADVEKNTSHNTSKKTGTETKVFGIDESETHTGTETKEKGINENETHTGTDTKDILIDETEIYKGRDVSGATLINEEIMLRNTQQFYDIVFNDIDSITALQIYI